nr:hypothetical protein [Tanacetum cinerariifolium]
MVDFIAASPLRYALTVKPTIYVSHIRQFWSTTRIKTTDEGTHILATVDGIQRTVSEASLRHNLKLRDEDGIVSIPDMELFENLTLMGFNEFSSNIATALVCLATNMTYNFSKMIFDGMVKNVATSHPTTSSIPLPSVPTAPIPTPTVADEPASLVRDVSEGEACPTESGFIADQDRATIAKTSTLPHDSAPRVTSHAADEGNLLRQLDREDLNQLWALVKEYLSIKPASSDKEMELWVKLKRMYEPDPEDQLWTLTQNYMHAPVEWKLYDLSGVHHIDAQVSKELEEQQEREDMRMNEQIARDTKVARIHAEEEIQGMIDSLDKSNETIAKYLHEYQEFALDLPLEKKIELISDLVKYQEHYTKVHKFQSQQRKPMSKKQKREYYMAVIKSHLGWRFKDFKGMTFEEIEVKFSEVWKQVEDFIPMGSKEESKRLKRKGLNLEKEQVKKQKSSEEPPEIETITKEFSEEKIKEMMQLVPVEDVYVQALQVKHPIIDWKVHSEGQRSYWKIIRLGGSSACYQFFVDLLRQLDREDLNHLWALLKEYLSIRIASSDKEMELWVELKR